MRPLIRYDLDEPPQNPVQHVGAANGRRPPSKKRKRNHHNSQRPPAVLPPSSHFQHWDDPGNTAVDVVYDESEVSASTLPPLAAPGSVAMSDAVHGEEQVEEEHGVGVEDWDEFADAEPEHWEEEEDGENEEEESRPLTHDEIWDDSALIDAWNSAQAEYEAYHGTSKSWQSEPIKKSPLWYNKPYTGPIAQPSPSNPKPPAKRIKTSYPQDQEAEPEPDTAPLDFHSYVPTHDPSLGITSNTATTTNPFMNAPPFVPSPSTTVVSRDEAFNNALNAMYWGGYWTAVYHCQSQTDGKNSKVQAETIEENGLEADKDKDAEDEDEDLVPAQR